MTFRSTGMSFGPEDAGEGYEQAPSSPPSERTTLPGIFLIVVGVLNILGGCILGLFGLAAASVPTEQLRKQLEQQNPGQLKQIEQAGWTVKNFQDWYMYAGYAGFAGAVVGILIIAGGIMLWTRKSYALALIGALLAAI